jgi:hypothetical protein
MQKIVVRKLKLSGTDNDYNAYTRKTVASSDCAKLEDIIQEEIDNGWKVVNVTSSCDGGWHCHVIVFVLEKEDKKE